MPHINNIIGAHELDQYSASIASNTINKSLPFSAASSASKICVIDIIKMRFSGCNVVGLESSPGLLSVGLICVFHSYNIQQITDTVKGSCAVWEVSVRG